MAKLRWVLLVLGVCAIAFAQDSRAQIQGRVTDPSGAVVFSGIRGEVLDNWDLSVIKNTYFTERTYLQSRAEFLNAFNHAQFSGPNTNPASTAFGTVTETAQMPRLMQFGLKLFF